MSSETETAAPAQQYAPPVGAHDAAATSSPATHAANAPRSRWQTVRQALRGAEGYDFTQGSIRRAIVLLSIPMVVEMFMESIFAVVDIFFVGRLGADAVATVGLTESMLTLVYALAMGFAMGTSAIVARRIGEQDADGAARTAVQALLMALAGSLVLGALGVWLAPDLLRLMGASPSVIGTGLGYTRVMLGGEASIIVLFVANAIFRGAGDAAIAMRVLMLANGINVVLAPCLIFGLGPFPELGVTGAAIATTIGRSIGALFAVSRLFRAGGRVAVSRRHLVLDPALMRSIFSVSGAAVFQSLIGTASWIGLVRIVAMYGSTAVAGYTIAIRVVIFALLPAWGVSNAGATMVGQSLGAKNPARAEQAVWMAARYNAYVLGLIGLVFLLVPQLIVGIFTSDPAVLEVGTTALRVISAGFVFYAFGMVLTAAFNGAGDTWTPTWINLGVFWALEIPLAWALARGLGWGPAGVFTAVVVAFSVLAVVSAVLFRRGGWKTRQV